MTILLTDPVETAAMPDGTSSHIRKERGSELMHMVSIAISIF